MQLSIFDVPTQSEPEPPKPSLSESAIAYWRGRANYYRRLIEKFFWAGQNGRTPPHVTRALIASAWGEVRECEQRLGV